jgi:hypothetical protein
MRLCVKFTPHINLEQVQFFITPNPAFLMPTSTFFYGDLRAHEKQSFETEIFINEESASEVSGIFSTELTIVVTFINKQSIARIRKHFVEVPMKNIAQVVPAQKDGIFKVTLHVSPIIDFAVLFSGELKLLSVYNYN